MPEFIHHLMDALIRFFSKNLNSNGCGNSRLATQNQAIIKGELI